MKQPGEAPVIGESEKPKLLLHACCAPCTTHVYKVLCEEFDVTVFFFNPNIQPDNEYDKRAAEMKKLAEIYGYELIIEPDNVESWFIATHGLEKEPEGGARCTPCFRMRLERTAIEAAEKGFDYFTTTLTVSPHKNAEVINREGERSAARHSVKYLESNFKKKDGYKKSCDLSAEYNLYRQDYCGCIFSLR